MDFQSNIFKALGHPLRLKIIKELIAKERCVCKLINNVEFTQANLSQHLRILLNAGLITKRKEGNFSYYRITDNNVASLIEICEQINKNYINKLTNKGE